MNALSEELTQSVAGLDHSMSSLHALDALAGTSETEVSTRALGAYLGR
jgi:hypothetical protein